MRRGGRTATLAAPGVLVCVSACGQPLYVARLGWAEAKILWRREPIGEVVRRPDVDAELRERLQLVLAARDFARDRLGFRVGESYTSYAEVAAHEATVHVVSAAYRDRLEAFTWWYPIAGRVPYRGFFDEASARAEADRLARRGLDVDVRPAIAFSTLGWFPDPLLSVTAEEKPVPLVATVLHELFHQTLYVPGEPAFNESAATFAGDRGAVAFFCDGPGADAARCDRARRGWDQTRAQAGSHPAGGPSCGACTRTTRAGRARRTRSGWRRRRRVPRALPPGRRIGRRPAQQRTPPGRASLCHTPGRLRGAGPG